MVHYVLGDIVTEISERENNPSNSSYERFVGLEHYVSGEVEIENYGSTSNLNSAMKVFKSGDILVARRNVYLKRASVVYFDGLTSGDSIVLRPKDETIGRILPFILNTDDFWNYADQHSDGTMSKRLSPKVLKKYEFDLPEENLEQFADTLWAMVDVKKSYQKLLKQTDELVKSQFIEMFGDPVRNDKEWPTKPIKEVAPETNADIPKDNENWWLNLDMIESYSGRLLDRVIEKSDAIGSSTHPFDDSMVLYSKLRPYLNKIFVPDSYGYATTELVALKPNPNELNKYFLFNLLRGDCFVNFANKSSSGAQMPRMQMKVLREFQCILPPMDLQNKFVEISEQADKSKFELKQDIEGVDVLIKSLIQQELN